MKYDEETEEEGKKRGMKTVIIIYHDFLPALRKGSSSSSSRDGPIGPLPAKCRPEAFDAHSFTTFRERGKTG